MVKKIFYGVPIYIIDNGIQVFDALVVVNGIVEFTGSFEEAMRLYPDASRVEIKEGCIVPGFIDAHINLEELCYYYKDGVLDGVEDIRELVEVVGGVVKERKSNDLLVFGGVENELIKKINRETLDTISAEKPVVLFSDDLQLATCNSKALEILSITRDRKDPYLGRIVRDNNGRPTGLLLGRAVEMLRRHVLSQRLRGIPLKLQKILSMLSSKGITAVCDFGFSSGMIYRHLFRLCVDGECSVRFILMYNVEDWARLTPFGLGSGFGNEIMRFGGCYFELDGGLESQTAYLRKRYRDTGASGILMVDEDALRKDVKKMYNSGVWTSLGCSGDGACEIAIKVFDSILSSRSGRNAFCRMDSGCVLEDGDVDDIARLNINMVVSPGRAVKERMFAIKAMGKDAGKAFRIKSLLSMGINVGFGSWAPYLPIDPIKQMYYAVERRSPGEGPELRFYPKERITIEDALYCTTKGSAVVCGIDGFTGSLLPGKRADFIHLSENIIEYDADKLIGTRVLATYISGEKVYERKGRNGEKGNSDSRISDESQE